MKFRIHTLFLLFTHSITDIIAVPNCPRLDGHWQRVNPDPKWRLRLSHVALTWLLLYPWEPQRFFFHVCDVAELAIIHNRVQPNLAINPIPKSTKFFFSPLSSQFWQHSRTQYRNLSIFPPGKIKEKKAVEIWLLEN